MTNNTVRIPKLLETVPQERCDQLLEKQWRARVWLNNNGKALARNSNLRMVFARASVARFL